MAGPEGDQRSSCGGASGLAAVSVACATLPRRLGPTEEVNESKRERLRAGTALAPSLEMEVLAASAILGEKVRSISGRAADALTDARRAGAAESLVGRSAAGAAAGLSSLIGATVLRRFGCLIFGALASADSSGIGPDGALSLRGLPSVFFFAFSSSHFLRAAGSAWNVPVTVSGKTSGVVGG